MRRRSTRRLISLFPLALCASLGVAFAMGAVGGGAPASDAVGPRLLSMTAGPPSRSVAAGGTGRFVVKAKRHHLTTSQRGKRNPGSLRFKVDGLPSGASALFWPSKTERRKPHRRITPLSISTSSKTPEGTYVLRIRGAARTRRGSATVTLKVVSAARPPVAPVSPVPPSAFSMRGALPAPLSPGMGQPLDVELTNLGDSDLSITQLHVALGLISAPESDTAHPCRAADFSVAQFSGDAGFTLPASSTRTLSDVGFPAEEWPSVSMLNLPVNQDGCKLATLALSFTGSSTGGTP